MTKGFISKKITPSHNQGKFKSIYKNGIKTLASTYVKAFYINETKQT